MNHKKRTKVRKNIDFYGVIGRIFIIYKKVRRRTQCDELINHHCVMKAR